MRLFHSSPIQDLKILEIGKNKKRHKDTEEQYVYLTDDVEFSICFGCKWDDWCGNLSFIDGEMYFSLDESVDLSSPCSLYIIDIDENEVEKIKTREYISKHDVYISEEIKFSPFSEALDYFHIPLYDLESFNFALKKCQTNDLDWNEYLLKNKINQRKR